MKNLDYLKELLLPSDAKSIIKRALLDSTVIVDLGEEFKEPPTLKVKDVFIDHKFEISVKGELRTGEMTGWIHESKFFPLSYSAKR